MNILLINHYAGSPDMGMEFRPYYFAREWVRTGHRVDIMAADFSHLRQKNPEVARDFQEELIDGIHYHWVKTGRYDGNGPARAFTMFRFVRKLRARAPRITEELEPDVVICSSTYPMDTYAGQKLRRVSSKPLRLIHEVHDMWPATLVEIGGMSRSNPFVVLVQKAEDSAYRNSDLVVSMAPYTRDYMKEHGLAEDRWVNIPLGIDLSEWQNRAPLGSEHRESINKLRSEGRFIVGYFGGHALSNALDTLLDCAALCKERVPEAHFVLVGSGVEKARLVKRAEDEGLDNMSFLPPVGRREIPELTGLFDCIYMGTFRSGLYRFGLCLNKMADAMMSGRPVISAISAPPTWVDMSGCGISTESEDAEGIAAAVRRLADMSPEERAAMGGKGAAYVREHLDVKMLAGQMADLFRPSAARG